ncbi:MAG TPA: hypothetical protein VKZ84_07155 [Bacteriovoracaceae bacterium]|nr:hypothetical protein [Bacteriovoracaceae bacterium]
MIIRLLGGLLLLTACGKQVSIDHTALEEASKLGSMETKSFQNGIINKMNNSGNAYLIRNSESFTISDKSSYLAKTFIRGLPAGQTNVIYKGKQEGKEFRIEEISRR